jgi:hypothetical protein
MFVSRFAVAGVACMLTMLAACSSDSSSSAAGAAASPVSATITGTVAASLVSGANVCVYAVNNGVRGAQLACGTTNALGVYSIPVTATGDVVIEATGGSYTDEATGQSTSLTTTLRSVVNVGSGGTVQGMVTPLTQVAFNQMGSTITAASFANAASALASQLGLGNVNLLTTAPTFNATNAQIATNAYAQWLGALSQYQASAGNLALGPFLQNWGASYQTALQTAFNSYNQFLAANGVTLPGLTVAFSGNTVNINTGTNLGATGRSCTISVLGIAAVCITNLPASEPCDNTVLTAPGISQALGSLAQAYSFATGASCSGALTTITF